MSIEENKALVRREVETVVHQLNFDAIREFWAPNGILHLQGAPDIVGPDAYLQFVTMYRTAFPDLRFTIEDMIGEGDQVAVRVTARGTHQGELQGIAPTGKAMTATGLWLVRIVDGKLVEGWLEWDALRVLQQLEVLPASFAPGPA